MKVIKIRCSALPAAFACPPSVLPVDVEIDPVSEPADQGSADHAVMKQIVEGDMRSLDGIDIKEIAAFWGVDRDDLTVHAFMSLQVWELVRNRFPDAQAEVDLTATFELSKDLILELSGHLDALSVVHRQRLANLGDWKYGRVDNNYAQQVRGYQALTIFNYDTVDTVHGFVGWMLDKDIEDYTMTRDQLWAWLEQVRDRIVNWDGVFHPGPQCGTCRRNHDCPALTAIARRDVLVFGGEQMGSSVAAGFKDLADAALITLYRRGRVLSKLIATLDAAVKLRVQAAGGRLEDGEGRELRILSSGRRVIDPLLAKPVLEARFTPEEIAGATVLRPSELDDAIAAKTARGGKKAAIEELDTALRAANAVVEHTTERLMDVRTKE